MNKELREKKIKYLTIKLNKINQLNISEGIMLDIYKYKYLYYFKFIEKKNIYQVYNKFKEHTLDITKELFDKLGNE
jgi:hypothetical protein